MRQTHFQFRQFKIEQCKCAMKVCTDACLFGALISENLSGKKNILDVGTGTGLLSLMYAQKNADAKIDAVEIDKDAAEQARENVFHSIWKENIEVYHQSIQQFANTRNARYDLILSNPPFFENDLKSSDIQRNKALHSSELTLKELIEIANKLLAANGSFCVLLPFSRMEYFIGLAEEADLYLTRQYLIRQTEKHTFFRSVLFFSKTEQEKISEDITIKISETYSLRFTELLKDYYLHL